MNADMTAGGEAQLTAAEKGTDRNPGGPSVAMWMARGSNERSGRTARHGSIAKRISQRTEVGTCDARPR